MPAVQAQPWNNSVQDGLCGLEQADAGLTNEDPNLVNFIPQNRSSCSNIADNPIQSAVPDKLIGIQRVLSRRRAKFVAVSGLTYDFMDTTGKLTSLEGELQSNDLISLMNNDDDHFGFSPGNTIQSTFHAPLLSPELHTASDFKTRFRQYIFNYNDRAYYSLACIIDGVCPVNFRDEITVGQV